MQKTASIPPKKRCRQTETQRKKVARGKESAEEQRARQEARNMADHLKRASQTVEERQETIRAKNEVDFQKRAKETVTKRQERLRARKEKAHLIRETARDTKYENVCQYPSV